MSPKAFRVRLGLEGLQVCCKIGWRQLDLSWAYPITGRDSKESEIIICSKCKTDLVLSFRSEINLLSFIAGRALTNIEVKLLDILLRLPGNGGLKLNYHLQKPHGPQIFC